MNKKFGIGNLFNYLNKQVEDIVQVNHTIYI